MIMGRFLKFFIIVLLPVFCACAVAGGQELLDLYSDEEVTATQQMNTGARQVAGTVSPGYEVQVYSGAVVKVDGKKIYVDKGAIDGVTEGTMMEIFRIDTIVGLEGEVLDEEEVDVGRVEIYEVRPRVSIGNLMDEEAEIKRGFIVRYASVRDNGPENRISDLCPAGMFLDTGGMFEYIPGSMSGADGQFVKKLGEVEPFCVDKYPGEGILTWAAAAAYCEQQDKRLCERVELEKICAEWEREKPCPRDIEAQGLCPNQDTVMRFGREQEWTADPVEGEPGRKDASSIACASHSPVVTHCYYEGCRGAKKIFRCCAGPQEPEKN
ncbi:MAG TPA: hypothetical protein PLN69_08690 [bacterium]|nr:hypothetical protein [bacterium]